MVDAAIFEEKEASGVGLVARDHGGQLILAKSKCYAELMNPMLAETMAIKEALSWAKQIEWMEVTIESDCLVVIQMIRSTAPMRSRLGMVVEECREIVRQSNNIKLVFVKRSTNIPAHELAHVSYMYPDCIFDWESVPVRIKVCIHQDLME